ncbi:MerR family DNA-binding transcriptional regulator [Muricomes intestini]|uniref:MerR family DNA-binding transcriptional regulator n=1 Tax=Muricomes intestini TaxID=1796634 RepID=UPI0010516F5A|nr:MerR family DNA-binding transcriptional regulator [Muricomes intestini]
MSYTIKKVSKLTNIPIPTLRYYEKEGLLPDLQKKRSGYYIFEDDDLEFIIPFCFGDFGCNPVLS